ncbi:unnamed protein product [Ilex paraguariensis]|uniref:Uncharacterized protein n=1 Tax=Ilex paraguariensis TaxID=185542 RepID=A0ABC8V2I4_9AQUA
MPQELPGFYYDAEKNRYFPIKGPIPGSSRYSSSSATARKTVSNSNLVTDACQHLILYVVNCEIMNYENENNTCLLF